MEWKGVGVRGCTGKYNFADFFIITIIFFYWIFPPLGPGHFAETMPSPRAAFMVCLCCCGCGCLSFGPNKMKSHNNSAWNYREKFEYSLNNILFHLFLLLLRTSTILFCSALLCSATRPATQSPRVFVFHTCLFRPSAVCALHQPNRLQLNPFEWAKVIRETIPRLLFAFNPPATPFHSN